MNIVCPQCEFSRTVDEATLPAKAVMATCPKCKHRFKFRELPFIADNEPAPSPEADLAPHQSQNQPPAPAAPQAPEKKTQPSSVHDDDLWTELEALNNHGSKATDDFDDSGYDDARPSTPQTLPIWERVTSDYPRAFIQTLADVLTNPKIFFSAMPVGHGYLRPLLFFLIIVQIVALSQMAWQLLGILPPSALTSELGASLQAALVLILYPLEVSLFLLLDTTINHFFLRLFKADTKGFEGTFRAAVYSAAPMLLMAVPFIGLPLAMIGVTVYKFLGLRHVHGATSKQIVAVLVLPMLLALTIGIILALIVGGI